MPTPPQHFVVRDYVAWSATDRLTLECVTSRSSFVFLVVARTLLCRFFRWRTSSRPKPRLPPMTKNDPGSGVKGVSSAEDVAIILVGIEDEPSFWWVLKMKI